MSVFDSFKEGYDEGQREADGFFAIIALFYKGLKWLMWGYLGVIFGILWLVCGLLCCVTVVGIPLSKEIFAAALEQFTFMNVRSVELNREEHPVANTVWCCTLGWILALLYTVIAVLMFATLILIPLGIAHLKAAKFAIMPFGADVY